MLASIDELAIFYQNVFDREISKSEALLLSRDEAHCIAFGEAYPGLFWGPGIGQERRTNDTIYWQWGNETHFQHLVLFSTATNEGLIIQTNSANGFAFIEEYVTKRFYPEPLTLFNYIKG